MADGGVTLHPRVDSRSDTRAVRVGVPGVLLGLAAIGWWWSIRMADEMAGMTMNAGISVSAFMLGWLAMMVAMMFPAISPVVRLYGAAAASRTVAPLPFFVSGYLVVWMVIALPAYFAWRALEMPIHEGRAWTGVLAGFVLLAAALWQLTPLKHTCLRNCRSPMSFFLRYGRSLGRPGGALRTGVMHGLFCVGCCWALFAVLVALGTMNVAWMIALTVLILVEKTATHGEFIARLSAVAFAAIGVMLIFNGSMIADLT